MTEEMARYYAEPDSTRARKEIGQFIKDVHWARGVHYIFVELFHDQEAGKLLRNSAATFFRDLNYIVLEYSLIQFCALTDAPKSGRKDENLTLKYLVQTFNWPKEQKNKLEDLSDKIGEFRKKIVKARSKIIAHHDRKIFLNNKVLGAFHEGEEVAFLENLEAACKIMYEACFCETYPEFYVPHPGDVRDLKRMLRSAAAFEKFIDEKQHSKECTHEEFHKLLNLKRE